MESKAEIKAEMDLNGDDVIDNTEYKKFIEKYQNDKKMKRKGLLVYLADKIVDLAVLGGAGAIMAVTGIIVI